MNQKGIIPLYILIGVLIIGSVGGFVYLKQIFNKAPRSNPPTASPSATPSSTPLPDKPKTISQKKPNPTAPTPSPAPKRTTAPTPAPAAFQTPSNPYDLNSPTGSVKVMVKAQSGDLGYTPLAELTTVSGFKVLDGRSTDKITQYGKDRTDYLRGEILFSTAPPGPYKVRISYNGVWSDQKDVTVSSGKQTDVEFTVAGVTPTPTPTPKPKPICNVLVMPSSSGSAPFEASVCVGNNSNPYQAVQQEFVDYDGNGSWDYQGPQYGCHSYTFQTPGTYSPKAKIIGSSGEESEICQTTVTFN